MAAYKAQFEGLSNTLKQLSEMHKPSCFLSGLKDDIQLLLRMLNPINLSVALGLAKIQEEYILTPRKSWRQNVVSVERGSFETASKVGYRMQRSNVPTKKGFSSQMDEKRRKSLCYHCEEKLNPAHVFKNPKLYLLQLDESAEGEEEHEYGPESVHKCEEVHQSQVEDLELSIHAIYGCPSCYF